MIHNHRVNFSKFLDNCRNRLANRVFVGNLTLICLRFDIIRLFEKLGTLNSLL
jgi:hypothetical protein